MQLTSARQAIHDAYALNLRSREFEVSQVAPIKKPDFSAFLRSAHRRKKETRKQLLSEHNPVGYYREDRSGKQNNNHRVADTVEAGMIISVVERLPEPIKSWAVWAYGPRTQDFLPEQARFFRWLDGDVMANVEAIDRVYREATRHKIRDVVAFTVLDYRSYILSERHLYPVSLIINRCRIQRQNWKRDFKPWHDYYWRLCDEYLDRYCLPAVGKVIARLKRGKSAWKLT